MNNSTSYSTTTCAHHRKVRLYYSMYSLQPLHRIACVHTVSQAHHTPDAEKSSRSRRAENRSGWRWRHGSRLIVIAHLDHCAMTACHQPRSMVEATSRTKRRSFCQTRSSAGAVRIAIPTAGRLACREAHSAANVTTARKCSCGRRFCRLSARRSKGSFIDCAIRRCRISPSSSAAQSKLPLQHGRQ
jgi:hypothetical protein